MSAFLAGNKTVNDVVTLAILKQGKHPEYLSSIDRVVYNAFGSHLIKLNSDSVNHRYKSNEEADLSFEYNPTIPSKVQLEKSLRCWHYQSCEFSSVEVESILEELECSEEMINAMRKSEDWNNCYYGD